MAAWRGKVGGVGGGSLGARPFPTQHRDPWGSHTTSILLMSRIRTEWEGLWPCPWDPRFPCRLEEVTWAETCRESGSSGSGGRGGGGGGGATAFRRPGTRKEHGAETG